MSIPVDASWKLTFDEEFNGNSINTDVWGTNWLGNDGAITKPISSQELGAYDPAQVSVSEGFLHLSLDYAPVTVNGISYDYRGGIVNTHDSFTQTYGYFEAKILLPGSGGKIDNWPAFWLDGETWPQDGEIDIMEGLGGDAAYHIHSPSGGPGGSVSGDFTGWHIFGALWEPGKVSFYYDNQLVGSISTNELNSPQFLILNFGVGLDSLVSSNSEMVVDWVHAYSNETSAVAVNAQAGYEGPGGSLPYNIVTGTGQDDNLSGSRDTDLITGKSGDDILRGMTNADVLRGGSGADLLIGGQGDDRLAGGPGADQIKGGAGRDLLVGGTGSDTFIFDNLAASRPAAGNSDNILDFSHAEGDLIDLSGIDANQGMNGDQAFDFIGMAAFSHHAGELRYEIKGSSIIVYGDVDGDGIADLGIQLRNLTDISVNDFIL